MKKREKTGNDLLLFIVVAALYFGACMGLLCSGVGREGMGGNVDGDGTGAYCDMDGDGIEDSRDILENARAYVDKRPKYGNRYYRGGYGDDGYGVCTDVIAAGLRGAGYDIRQLINDDYRKDSRGYSEEAYDIDSAYRRVCNLNNYFKGHFESLTTDVKITEQWQGGDIVVFKGHIGIVSDKRNKNGVPYVIHHSGPDQKKYEEDFLEYRSDILGHYRVKC